MKKMTWFYVGILAFAVAAIGCSSQSASMPKADFVAQLSGDDEVPPVSTSATGTASFWLSPDGTKIRFNLTVGGVKDLTEAELYLGARGDNNHGVPIVWLYPDIGPAERLGGVSDGTVSQFSFGADKLANQMAGKTISDLIAAIRANNVYVNVHSSQHPGGLIRGQLSQP